MRQQASTHDFECDSPNKSEMPLEQKRRSIGAGEVCCENQSLLKAFPFAFTIDRSMRIVAFGRTLRRYAPSLLGKSFADFVKIERPATPSTGKDLFGLANTLCILSFSVSDIRLRGEFIFHDEKFFATFVGTVYAASYADLGSLNISKEDLAKHDMTIDLAVFTQLHEQHADDLVRLNARLRREIDLRAKYQAAEESVSKQLRLAADMRLVIKDARVVEFQTNALAGNIIDGGQEFTPDEKTLTDVELFALVPALSSVNGLDEFLVSTKKNFRFDLDSGTAGRNSVFEGQCERLEDGTVFMLIRDITRQRELQQSLEYRANYDQLTGLANRDVLFSELTKIYESGSRVDIEQSYLLIIDLDNFKSVNDILGHAAGDRLLQIASNRIKESVRKNDLVTRLGGDEFAVIVRDVKSDSADLDPLLNRLEQYMSKDVDLRGFAWSPESSMGVAPLSSGNNATDVMKNADLTMYDAKRAGKAKIHRYSSAIRDQTVDDIKIQHNLKYGVHNDLLSADFQPIFDLTNKSIVALEALARWQDPDLGAISPDRFIALSEKSDLIFALTESMLRKSISAHFQLRDRKIISDGVSMHVNVSPSVFRIGDFHEIVERTLESSEMRPDCLVLEMTESVIVHDEESVRAQLTALSDIGVKLAIDDFGKGYSSLGYLEAYPFDILKIDRQFVSQLHSRAVPYRLSTAILSLARALDLSVIAEGIEQAGELHALQQMGCQMGQGYYLAKPTSLEHIEQVLANFDVVA